MNPTPSQSALTRRKAMEAEAGSGLHRTLGVMPLAMLGIGATIGTGIFFVLPEAVPKAGPAVILSFVIAAITAGLTALCYAELSARIPGSGSSYTYTYATLGEFAAFVVAACLLLEYGLAASATAIGWSAYLNNFLENTIGWQIPDALRSPMIVSGKDGAEFHAGKFNLPPVLLVILCGVLLVRGVKESVGTNTVLVWIKIAVLVFFAAIAFTAFNSAHFTPFFFPEDGKGGGGMAGVTAAAATVFFSFIGLDTVATGGSEAKDPKRTVPLAILIALLVVTGVYFLVAIAAVGAQPAGKFAGQDAGLAVIVKEVTGQAWPAVVLSAGAVISVFSVTLASLYGQTRILYSMSRDGLVGQRFSLVDAVSRTPRANTVIVCIVVAIIAGAVDSGFLWDMVSMGTLTAFALVSAAVPVVRAMQMRDGTQDTAGFRVPFGPYLIPFASIASCLYIMKDLSKTTFTVFGVWIALALAWYMSFAMKNSALAKS
ncbi:MAG: amino acid permease [Betaproteobacteria bacterium]|nr:amino acid permease [Betaproteobacteria bacterium]